MHRLFVALPLPEDVTDRLARMGGGLANTRWVAPANMHLTLRFIGEVEGHVFRDVDTALSGIAAPTFEMALAGLGTFGNGKKVNALWVGVDAPEQLTDLQHKVEKAVQRAGLPGEGRKFRPHVTIARVKGPPGNKLGDFLRAHSLFRCAPFHVDRFQLVSSQRTPKGPVYRVEAEYPLEPDVPAPLA